MKNDMNCLNDFKRFYTSNSKSMIVSVDNISSRNHWPITNRFRNNK